MAILRLPASTGRDLVVLTVCVVTIATVDVVEGSCIACARSILREEFFNQCVQALHRRNPM